MRIKPGEKFDFWQKLNFWQKFNLFLLRAFANCCYNRAIMAHDGRAAGAQVQAGSDVGTATDASKSLKLRNRRAGSRSG
jgi:hypothetical protein